MTRDHDRARGSGVCLLGALPPPVHGMAMINAAVRDALHERGASVVMLDVAGGSLDRRLVRRIGRLPRVGKALLAYGRELAARRGETLYVGLSAGWGQLYEMLFIALARARGARLFLHHHSFAYVERTTLPARLVMAVAGRSAIHVALCGSMEQGLRDRYPRVSITKIVSNAALTQGGASRRRSQLQTLGFLGNISRAKGIIDVLELARRLAPYEIATRIAGPFEDHSIETEVNRSLATLPNAHYVGPKYGLDKDAFLDSIDALLFPSTLTEAAPLVVLEAMNRGIPVIARDRGCLMSMVSESAGAVVVRDGNYVEAAFNRIMRWHREPDLFSRASDAAVDESLQQSTESRRHLNELLDQVLLATAPVP